MGRYISILNRYALVLLSAFQLAVPVVVQAAAVSPAGVWQAVESEELGRRQAVASEEDIWIQATKFKAFRLNSDALGTVVAGALLEQPEQALSIPENAANIHLPTPDGKFMAFRFVESPIMEPELAARFPEIKTYAGRSIDDPSISVRFDFTPAGFHAQVLGPEGSWSIDPLYKDRNDLYGSYFRSDYPRGKKSHQCLTDEDDREAVSPLLSVRSGDIRRTYRLAVASTGEYSQFHGGTVARALAAIVTTINRVNGIYEQEFAIRLRLVANNHRIVYPNPATDPFTGNNNSSVLIGQSQRTINRVIGVANYDIGHTFSTGAGGRALLGAVCAYWGKAMGVTGLSRPVGDPYDVDYVAHEIGHQFSGTHTFNGKNGSCSGGNRTGSTAYEPGSGSTIMAYAGICGADNLQTHSDPIFHSASQAQIMEFVTSGGGSACGGRVTLNNNIPSVYAGADYTIPKRTPFVLTGSSRDNDPGDAPTYLWEELDRGPPAALAARDDGRIPLFRVFRPVRTVKRYLPRLAILKAGLTDVEEKIPQRGRTMKFRFTARDGAGGVASDDTQVTVAGNAGPFRVIAPNGGERLRDYTRVTWNPANTRADPVKATHVDMFLSVDGGQSFDLRKPFVSATPNDGSEMVLLPARKTSNGRIMIKGTDNIFFDISDGNFSVTPGRPPAANLVVPRGSSTDTTPTYTWQAVRKSTKYYLWVTDSRGTRIKKWYGATWAGCGDGTGTCSITPATEVLGDSTWQVQTFRGGILGPWSGRLSFFAGAPRPDAAILISPSGLVADTTPTFVWNAVPDSVRYLLWVEDASGVRVRKWYSDAEAGCPTATGTCSITRNQKFGGASKWWVRTYSTGGYGPWSAGMAFVAGGPLPGPATPVSPSGAISDASPTYIWDAGSDASWYYLWVNDSGGKRIAKWFTAEEVGCSGGTSSCQTTPDTVLAEGDGTWWVRTWNDIGLGPWSSGSSFHLGALTAHREGFSAGLAEARVVNTAER